MNANLKDTNWGGDENPILPGSSPPAISYSSLFLAIKCTTNVVIAKTRPNEETPVQP